MLGTPFLSAATTDLTKMSTAMSMLMKASVQVQPYCWIKMVEPIPVTPVKLLGGGTAAATPGTTQKPMTNRTSELESVLKQMQIDYKTLRAAAAGRSASQHGLNMTEMKHVLNHFKIESSGKREDLNLKLSGLLISLEMK
jgi:cell division septum initiation protein DivIVA